MIKLRTALAVAGGLAVTLALGSVQISAQALPKPLVSADVAQSRIELVAQRFSTNCVTPKGSCKFRGGGAFPVGTPCTCRKTKGSMH